MAKGLDKKKDKNHPINKKRPLAMQEVLCVY